jgi:hypothetical protein
VCFVFQDIICFTVQLAYFVECIDKRTGQTVWEHLFQWLKDGRYEYKIPQALRFIEDAEQDNTTSKAYIRFYSSSGRFRGGAQGVRPSLFCSKFTTKYK